MDSLKPKGKELLLGALLVAIAATVWRQLGSESPSGGPGRRGGPVLKADLASLRVFAVDWEALSAPRPSYEPGRNIFQFGAVPVPTPPPPTEAEKAAIKSVQDALQRQQAEAAAAAARAAAEEAARQAEIQKAQANLPPPPPPRPVPPAINYKFIGYIGPPEHKIAVLHDGTDLLFARQGEVIGQSFRILEIGYESIKIGYTDPQFKGEFQTLPMSSSY